MHLLDYSQFIKENGNPYTKSPEEQKRLHCWEFYLWAEFHAKQVGLWFYSMYTWYEYGLETPPDGRYSCTIDLQTKSVEEPLDRFLPGRALSSANKLLWDIIIALVNYYARLSLDESIGPDSIPDPAFPREKLVRALGEPALELFPLLKRMRFYGEAISLLPSLSALFDKIVAKLNTESPWSALRSIQFDQLSAVQDQMRQAIESIGRSMSMANVFKSCADAFQVLKKDKGSQQGDDKDKAKG